MDITQQELKSMKAKQLRRLIREAIEEVLNEKGPGLYKLKNQADAAKGLPQTIDPDDATEDSPAFKSKYQKVSEGELDEAKGYKLTNPNMNINITNPRTGEPAKIGGVLFSDILATIRDTEGISDKQLFTKFQYNPETGIGLKKVQQLNGMLKGLKDAGVIDRLGRGGEVEVAPEPGEEQPEDVTGPEALFVGSGNPLAQYFDDVPNAGGEEDFNAEEEPTVGDIEPGTPVSAASMSDEDYEAFMKYGELSDRLAATKSNLLKMKRRKGGVAGDISDKPSNEEQNLRNLKKSLEDRINALVAGSKYLQKKVEKETGKPYEPIEVEPEEEDTIDEAFDAEYTKRKLQFYAGIIK